MKKTLLYTIIGLITVLTVQKSYSQTRPDYKVPVPNVVSLSKACLNFKPDNSGIYSYLNTIDMFSDENNDIYILTLTTKNTNLIPQITFADNSTSPRTFEPSELTSLTGNGYANCYFLSKYKIDGTLDWVTSFNRMPIKYFVDEYENKVILLFDYGNIPLVINGETQATDSFSYYGGKRFIYSISKNTGELVSSYNHLGTIDLVYAGTNKILIKNDNLVPAASSIYYGFFKNNNVVKWQKATNNSDSILVYNKTQNNLWLIKSFLYDKYRICTISSDSLIFDNTEKTLFFNPNSIPQEKIVKMKLKKSGGYIAKTSYGNFVNMDSNSNLIWKIKFIDNIYDRDFTIDNDDNMWLNFNSQGLSQTLTIEPSNKKYFINVGLDAYLSYQWKIDGKTGEVMGYYINGYGSDGYGVNNGYSVYGKTISLITKSNVLVNNSALHSIVYFPDITGNYKPYYCTCSKDYNSFPFQTVWAAFDLNDFHTMNLPGENDPIFNTFKVYPNPSQGSFTIENTSPAQYKLYDMMGRLTAEIVTDSENFKVENLNLKKGIYFLINTNTGDNRKIIVE